MNATLLKVLATLPVLPWIGHAAGPAGFPHDLPDRKPERPPSVAMERLYDDYLAPTPEANEL